MKTSTKITLLLIAPFFLFAVYYGLRRTVWKTKGEKSWATQHQLESKWSNNPFQLTADTPNIEEAIRRRLEDQQLSLNNTQTAAMAKELARMFLAYSTGSPKRFINFRFPAVNNRFVRWNKDLMDFQKGALEANGVNVSGTGNEYADNVELTRQFFEWSSGLTNNLGQRRWCGSCWAAMALDTLKVSSPNSNPSFSSLQALAESEDTINFTRAPGLATYSPPGGIRPDRFQFVAFTIRTDDKLPAYRVYVSKWFPQEMIFPLVSNEIATVLF
jgi:hypothetical protein